MLTSFFPLTLIITVFLIFSGIKLIRRKITTLKFIYLILLGVYTANLINLTFFPFPFQNQLIEIMIEDHLGLKHNLIPFKGLSDGFKTNYFIIPIIQLIKNVILFIPLGFLMPLIYSEIKIKKIILIGFLTSLSIEITQFLLGQIIGYNYRSFDIDDLITNTTGTILGILAYKILCSVAKFEKIIVDK